MSKKWETREYLTMKKVNAATGHLSVEFSNGDIVEVPLSAITPPQMDQIQWTEAYISDDFMHVIAPGIPHSVEIPWHLIRVLNDPEFARHMSERASKQSEYIGSRLRELRLKRGFTQAQVATRAAIEPANLSRIENEHVDVSASTLWKLLGAMGCSPADLAPSNTESTTQWESARS